METTVTIDELADIMRSLGMSADEAPSFKDVVEGSIANAA